MVNRAKQPNKRYIISGDLVIPNVPSRLSVKRLMTNICLIFMSLRGPNMIVRGPNMINNPFISQSFVAGWKEYAYKPIINQNTDSTGGSVVSESRLGNGYVRGLKTVSLSPSCYLSKQCRR